VCGEIETLFLILLVFGKQVVMEIKDTYVIGQLADQDTVQALITIELGIGDLWVFEEVGGAVVLEVTVWLFGVLV
jgi:hypothetical protein